MRASEKAWVAIGAFVLTFDACCEEGDTLSEAADAWMLHHPWLVRGVALAVAGHVCNLWPARLDPVHGLFVLTRRWRRP